MYVPLTECRRRVVADRWVLNGAAECGDVAAAAVAISFHRLRAVKEVERIEQIQKYPALRCRRAAEAVGQYSYIYIYIYRNI